MTTQSSLSAKPPSPGRLVVGALVVLVAGVAQVGLLLLQGAVRVALFPRLVSKGTSSLLWSCAFGLYVWAGSLAVGVASDTAILLSIVAFLACGLFIYMRGSGLDEPPAAQPGAFLRRRAGGGAPRPDGGEVEPHVEQHRWLAWFGLPALVAAVFVGLTFATGQEWYLGIAIAAIITDIGILVYLALTTDTNRGPTETSGHH